MGINLVSTAISLQCGATFLAHGCLFLPPAIFPAYLILLSDRLVYGDLG